MKEALRDHNYCSSGGSVTLVPSTDAEDHRIAEHDTCATDNVNTLLHHTVHHITYYSEFVVKGNVLELSIPYSRKFLHGAKFRVFRG